VANDNDSGSSLLAIVGAAAIGAAVGATAALLLAPKAGEETREGLKVVADKARVRAEELKNKVVETVDELKQRMDEHFPMKCSEDAEEAVEEADEEAPAEA